MLSNSVMSEKEENKKQIYGSAWEELTNEKQTIDTCDNMDECDRLNTGKLAEKITYVLYVVLFILRTETTDTTSKKIHQNKCLPLRDGDSLYWAGGNFWCERNIFHTNWCVYIVKSCVYTT